MRLVSSKHVQKASNVLDNTTLMLERITALQEDEVMRQQVIAGYGFNDGIDFEKYLANLEHMLRCLQQAAFQALVQHSLEALQTDYSHWSKYLEQVQRSCADWYSEWSSGRPPLNSRMPWNIKPSLVVLWGVCWMFYMPNAPTSDAEQPGEESWLAQPYPQPTMANPGKRIEKFAPFCASLTLLMTGRPRKRLFGEDEPHHWAFTARPEYAARQ